MLFTDSKSKYVTIFFLLAQMFHHYFLPMLSIFNVLGFFSAHCFLFHWCFTMLSPQIVLKIQKNKIKRKNI